MEITSFAQSVNHTPPQIFLITPPKSFSERSMTPKSMHLPNLGLAYLDAYISQKNYISSIYDLNYITLKEFRKILETKNPNLVGITATTEEMLAVKRIVHVIKQLLPKIIIVLGGAHATALPRATLQEIPMLDFIVIGEGEQTFVELLDHIFKDTMKKTTNISGIAFRNGKSIIINPPRPLIENLDILPFPTWNKYGTKIIQPFTTNSSTETLGLPLITKRGCPFHCIFCQKVMGHSVRVRSIENIIEEIKFNLIHNGISKIYIVDDTFNYFKDRAMQFCKTIIKEGLHKKIKWTCSARMDNIDETLIRYMKIAGCKHIFFGLETGNPNMLKIIKKGITLHQAENAISLTKKYQIESQIGIIYGLPFETIHTLNDSLKFVLSNRPDLVQFSLLVPFPGTTTYEYAKTGKGGLKLIANCWHDYNLEMGHASALTHLSRRYIEMFQIYSYIRFYFHPFSFQKLKTLVNFSNLLKFLVEKLRGIFVFHLKNI